MQIYFVLASISGFIPEQDTQVILCRILCGGFGKRGTAIILANSLPTDYDLRDSD